MDAIEDVENLCLLADFKRVKLERQQAVAALNLIVEQRRANSLTGLLDSIDAADLLLTKLNNV
jgi:hypothetical protein